MDKKIILTGGGTAGHVTPNIALIPGLQTAGFAVHYIGSKQGIEHALLEHYDIPFHSISAGKLRRYLSWHNLTDIFRVELGFLQSLKLLWHIKPDVVFSKGGFVAAPVVWAASLLGIPIIIHESDMTPGLANRLSIPFASRICYSFPETSRYLKSKKITCTGIPVRKELLNGDADQACRILHFRKVKPVILVIGGSLGSEEINRMIRDQLDELLARFNIVHICGTGHLKESLNASPGYRQYEYLHENLSHILALADIVVSRAGATILFELLALNKPNLLVPLSRKASRGDQVMNAASFEASGYSAVFKEKPGNALLSEAIEQLYQDRDTYIHAMRKADESRATCRVLDAITSEIP